MRCTARPTGAVRPQPPQPLQVETPQVKVPPPVVSVDPAGCCWSCLACCAARNPTPARPPHATGPTQPRHATPRCTARPRPVRRSGVRHGVAAPVGCGGHVACVRRAAEARLTHSMPGHASAPAGAPHGLVPPPPPGLHPPLAPPRPIGHPPRRGAPKSMPQAQLTPRPHFGWGGGDPRGCARADVVPARSRPAQVEEPKVPVCKPSAPLCDMTSGTCAATCSTSEFGEHPPPPSPPCPSPHARALLLVHGHPDPLPRPSPLPWLPPLAPASSLPVHSPSPPCPPDLAPSETTAPTPSLIAPPPALLTRHLRPGLHRRVRQDRQVRRLHLRPGRGEVLQQDRRRLLRHPEVHRQGLPAR
jgi:hypothetical protein